MNSVWLDAEALAHRPFYLKDVGQLFTFVEMLILSLQVIFGSRPRHELLAIPVDKGPWKRLLSHCSNWFGWLLGKNLLKERLPWLIWSRICRERDDWQLVVAIGLKCILKARRWLGMIQQWLLFWLDQLAGIIKPLILFCIGVLLQGLSQVTERNWVWSDSFRLNVLYYLILI